MQGGKRYLIGMVQKKNETLNSLKDAMLKQFRAVLIGITVNWGEVNSSHLEYDLTQGTPAKEI